MISGYIDGKEYVAAKCLYYTWIAIFRVGKSATLKTANVQQFKQLSATTRTSRKKIRAGVVFFRKKYCNFAAGSYAIDCGL